MIVREKRRWLTEGEWLYVAGHNLVISNKPET